MRVLIVSYFFPPYNTIGAVRVGKQAKYLEKHGHETRVITANPQPADRSLPLEIPEDHVRSTPWINVNRPVELALGGSARVAQSGFEVGSRGGLVRGVARALGRTYKSVVHLPDGQIGWYPYALRAGKRLIDEWKPDVIYASASPLTSLLIAARLSRWSGVPWVAELRDLWLDNPNRAIGPLRKAWEAPLEAFILQSARGIVTVSEPLAEVLERKSGRAVCVVLNGYDEDSAISAEAEPHQDSTFRITYTGMIYAGKQDPSPLFQALALLGPSKTSVRVEFVGRYLGGIKDLARRYGVEESVVVTNAVPYTDALDLQRKSDALLLLLWNDPAELGVYTGKLFEYIGARRPVLAIGQEDGVAAQLIRDRAVGYVYSEPDEIARQLREWMGEKASRGRVNFTSTASVADLSREAQTKRLISFLHDVVQSVGVRA